MTLLERWDWFSKRYAVGEGSYRTIPADDIRRALAIAQAKDKMRELPGQVRFSPIEAASWLETVADELLRGKAG